MNCRLKGEAYNCKKLLEKEIGENIQDLGLDKELLDDTKSIIHKRKNGYIGPFNKNFCSAKDPVKRMKISYRLGKNICK